jgi:Ca-activated chloride channel family protein
VNINISPRMLAVIFALLLPGLQPRADEIPGEKVESPYFAVQGDARLESLPLKETRVEAKLNGVIASVHLRQVYRNQGATPINARYIFPGSTRAAMSGMTMTIGDRKLVAKIKEKEQATAIFAAAKAAGKSAALLSQKRPNVFAMDVANILPGDEVLIDLEYTEILGAEQGVYEFVYPGAVGPRYAGDAPRTASETRWIGNPYLHAGDSGQMRYDIEVQMNSPLPINDLRSDTHTILSNWRGPKAVNVRLAQPGADASIRDFVLRYRLQGDALLTGLTRFKLGGENYFMLLAQPPNRLNPAEMPARDYLFIVDVSGSMDGFPLETARSLVTRMIGDLGERDSFNILFFAGGSQTLAAAPLAATPENKARAVAMLSIIRGAGGTELLAALQQALAMPRAENQSRSIVVVTDGYISAEAEAFQLIDSHLGDSNLFAFGIGTSVNRFLIEGLAKAGHAESFVVSDAATAAREAERFRRYISAPLLTHIQLKGNKVELFDLEPAAQPDLLAERPVMALGKYRNGDPGATIELEGLAGDGAHHWSYPLADATEDAGLPKLWARKRLERLYVLPAPNGESRNEIMALGLKYSLLTSATSFVAVDETVRAKEAATDVKQPLPLPTGVSDAAVGEPRPMPEPEWTWLAGWMALWLTMRRLRERLIRG